MTALLTFRELAAALAVPELTLRRTIVGLRRDRGFPQPLAGSGGRYDPVAVDAWRRRQAGLSADATPTPPPEPDAIEAWKAELDRRSASMGVA